MLMSKHDVGAVCVCVCEVDSLAQDVKNGFIYFLPLNFQHVNFDFYTLLCMYAL